MRSLTRNFPFHLKRQLYSVKKFNISGEINIKQSEQQEFFPVKGKPTFTNGLYTIFEYKPEPVQKDEEGHFQRLPQVPYEIKEHALKAFVYTTTLVFVGRFLTNFSYLFWVGASTYFSYIPFTVFAYHYSRPLWYMTNAVSAVRLKEDGQKVVFEFKNKLRRDLEVDIRRIHKGKPENFINECYSEPFLFPIELDYTDVYSKYSLRSKQRVWLYGDSHGCIKDGEIFRAVLNSQSINLK